MRNYVNVVQDQNGRPVAGASVTVKLAGTATLASLFTDDGVTPTTNPVVTDALGRFNFYLIDGRYDVSVSGAGITTFTLLNQEIVDVTEENAADTVWVVRSNGLQIGAPPNVLSLAVLPTAPRTVTFPDNTGTIAELNLAQTWTNPQTFNSGDLLLAGVTSGTTTINATAVASGVITVPAATDTLVARATTDTLTNKTFQGSGSGTTAVVLQPGVAANSYNVQLNTPAAGRNLTISDPAATAAFVFDVATQTLTNKTLTAPVISTITNGGTLTLPTGPDTLVGRSTTDTLLNKTLTSPIISTPTLNGTPTGTSLQGTDTKLLTADGTGSTGASFCRDASGGATTSGCVASGTIQASSITTLGGDVAVSATTVTTVTTKAVTMPSSGCPCRAFVSYEAGATTSNSGNIEMWINDGTNNFATGGMNTTGSVGPPTQFHMTAGSFSTGTYSNSANITFTWRVESEQAITIRQSSQFSPQGSWLNVTIFTSN